MTACFMRDSFGSLLYLSLEKKIDIGEVLKYPLTPYPLALSHVDGSMIKSPKSAVLKYLESKLVSEPPSSVDVTIIDAMFFLHLHTNLPSSFHGVAHYLLARICECAGSTIYFVADKWISPSIKDLEREKRATSSEFIYSINGPVQKRPGNWLSALRSNTFKESLLKFLTDHWKNDEFAEVIGNKTLYANYNDCCFKYKKDGIRMVCEEVIDRYCTHEEADTRMFYYLNHVSNPSNVVIRTTDTDCLVIALGNKHIYHPEVTIWLEVGVQSNNTQRFIYVNGLHTQLGQEFCKSLIGYHALTGCDYTASFCRKGKVKPLKILEKNEDFQKALTAFAFSEVNEETLEVIESYVCRMYGKTKLNKINDVRVQEFLGKYRPKNDNERLSCVKKLDGTMLPPCQKVLAQKLRRVEMISKRWTSSTSRHTSFEVPEESGWILQDDTSYGINWYDGESSPSLDMVCDNYNGYSSEDEGIYRVKMKVYTE